MTPELWHRLKPLYQASQGLTGAERSRFIAEACGDDQQLREELQALLRASDEQTRFEDGPLPHAFRPPAAELQSLSKGEVVLGRFRIVRPLGSGGMGDVYEAIDLELSQSVALKTIRSDIAGKPGVLARFKREVQLSRRATGPNVCRIHELFVVPGSSNTADRAFLTMELLEGTTLADKLRQSGPMPWRDAQRIAVDICNGLSTIHQAGIIHRDLKTRNIMLTGRPGAERAVVMDFGLALELSSSEPEDQTGLTRPGAILGTPEYMAPEQFEAKPVSPATDVYALGIVLYELVTGKHPFAAATSFAAAVQRARRPKQVSALQPGLPRRWDAVINKCLEYDADQRFQSPREVAEALADKGNRLARVQKRWFRSLAAGVSPVLLVPGLLLVPAMRERLQGVLFSSSQKHIAVLPFDAQGNNPDTQALADGLMDSLSGKLSNLDAANQALWIVPAVEIREHKTHDPSSAWREFGATIVVKGRVRRENQSIHVNLALIDAQNLRQIGSAELEDKPDNIGALEDDAVQRIARFINVSDNRSPAAEGAQPTGSASYEDYLTALGYMQRYDQAGNLDRAISNLQSATKTDPSFALGYAQLGEAYRLKYQLDHDPKWLKAAEASCKTGLQIGGQIPAVYVTLAKVQESTGHHDLAVQELQQALALDPRNADAIGGLATAYQHAGRTAEAEAMYKKAIALRPDYWDGYEELGNFYDTHGRSTDAIREYQHAAQLTPDNSQVYLNLGGAYINSGDTKLFPEAESALKKSISLSPRYEAFANLSYLYTLQSRYPEAADAAEKAVNLNQNNYLAWANLLTAYQWLGVKDKISYARTRMIPLVQRAVDLNPQDGEAQSMLALLYAGEGMKEKAVQRIQTAVALAHDSPVVLSNVGGTYELLGDRRHAVEYFGRRC